MGRRDARILLQKGDMVRVEGATLEEPVKVAGAAGFTVESRGRLYLWHERGAVWTSTLLDRKDAERARFSRAAGSGGR
jgi:hypothetical protein